MTKVKTICKVLCAEAVVIGLVLSSGAYSRHRYYQGYTNGLLDGVSTSSTMSN